MSFSRQLLVILFALASYNALAQCQSSIHGSVKSTSGEILIGATIVILPGNAGQVADINGAFHFGKLCDGRYQLSVQYLGFKTFETQIELKGSSTLTITLEPEVSKLNEVVVHAEHEETQHVQHYNILTQRDLAATAGKTLGESLKEIPGVSAIQAGPGIFKPVIHGVHSNRVLILNYGIRQEGQQWGAEHAPEVDPFIASEMIVIKDASSIKYGTDALGGVVVVNPPPLPSEAGLGGTINAIAQSNGRGGILTGMLEGGIKNAPGWGWRLQGTAKRIGDYHTPTYSLTNTGTQETDFSAATRYHGKRAGVEVFFSHFQTQLGILKGTSIGNPTDLITAFETEPPQNTSAFSYQIGEPRQAIQHSLLKVSGHADTRSGSWHFQYGFQDNKRKEFDIRPGSLSSIPALDLKLNTHTFEAEWETKPNDKNQFCFGANGMLQKNDNVPGTQRIPFIPNYTSVNGGPFAVLKFFLGKWTIDAGTRYDFRTFSVAGYDSKNTYYSASPRFQNISATAGTSYQLSPSQTLSLNASTAWRPPHVAELYSVGTHQSAAAIEYGLLLNSTTNEVMNINDVDFKIEKALKFVGGYKLEGEKFEAEVTAYSNLIYNYIYLKPSGLTQNVRGTYAYLRYAQTDALFLGSDLAAKWKPTQRISLMPKISLLRASDVTNSDYLLFIPSNRYELTGRFDFGKAGMLRDIFLESKWKFVDKQRRAPRVITIRELKDAYDNGTDPLKGDNRNFDFLAAPSGYFLWNMSTGTTVPTAKGRYEFRVTVENMLNASYREYTNRFRYYADEIGFNLTVSAKYMF